MHSIHPFGHHSHDEVNYLLRQGQPLLAVRPQTESHEHVLPYVQHVVLAELHDGPHTVGYVLDPRAPLPVRVDHVEYIPDFNIQLGMADVPHHEYGHHEYGHHEEHHGGGLFHRLGDMFGDDDEGRHH